MQREKMIQCQARVRFIIDNLLLEGNNYGLFRTMCSSAHYPKDSEILNVINLI